MRVTDLTDNKEALLGDKGFLDRQEMTTAIKDYEELIAAKKKEIDELTASIEMKMQRICELAISIVQMKNDLTDKKEALLGDKGFLDGLEKGCAGHGLLWNL